jgi:hypothetical protein
LADDTSAQTTRMLQREDNCQVKPKNQHKSKRRKSRDLCEASLPPEQNDTPVSNSGPGPSQQQQHIPQRPRSSPAMDEQLVEMTAVLHNPGGLSGGTNVNHINNKSSATPAPSTRHSHSGAHSPAIVQIAPQQQSESNCVIASPSHPSQLQTNYHQQQVPQAYQPPDYYNIQPQPQPPPPSATTLQSRRHQLRSRDSSRWSLSQENLEENMSSNKMEECCMMSSGNIVNGGSSDIMQNYCPIQACAGTALDLSDAPLPPPPSHQFFQTDSNNCAYVMSGSCSQDPLEIVVSSSSGRCYNNTSNNYQPQNVTGRLNRHSSSIEAIE